MVTKTTLTWAIIIALIVGGLLGYSMKGGSSASENEEYSDASITNSNPEKQITLYTTMRKLWSDHVLWTREYMIDAVAGLPSANAAATRLMKNQEDIGSAIGSYYGSDAGKQATTLLKEHITIAVDIVAAAKAKDKAKLDAANARWQENAEKIATLLSGANPNWPKGTILDMMKMHLSTTADELNAIIAKNYSGSISAFDKVFDHINKMSDAISAGIIKQFPEKF